MLQGKVVITFEYDEKNEKCKTEMKQVGKDTLKKDDLILLFQHLVGELMAED
jgi:flagellar basal body-associated protein FliL